MPISEKEVFAALMQDPNHAYNPIEKVWAEAQQRARQFRNNEKALALAFDTSPALEKLFDFIQKAVDEDDYKHKLIENLESYKDFFERAKELFRLEASWGDFSEFDPGQVIRMGGNDISLRNFNDLLKTVYPGFAALNEFVERLNSDQDLTFADAIENESPEFKMFMDSWIRDNGELSPRLSSGLTNYEAHADIQQWNDEARAALNEPEPGSDTNEEDNSDQEDVPIPEGNAGLEAFHNLSADEKRLFQAQMGVGIGSEADARDEAMIHIDAVAPDEFKNKVDWFVQGLALPTMQQRTAYWGSYTPLVPSPNTDNRGYAEEDDDESDEQITPDPQPTPDPNNEEDERRSYAGNINEGYRKFTPRSLKGDDEEAQELFPRVKGEEYKPFDLDLNNPNTLDEAISTLVEEYARMHEADEEGTPHLGSENPTFPGGVNAKRQWEFGKEDFNTTHKKAYNELNANKAVIEEYLRVLFNARAGTIDDEGEASLLPWSDHAPSQEYRRDEHTSSLSWDGLMGTELNRGLEPTEVRMNPLPHPGAWDWYQLLNTASGLQYALGTDEDSYSDENGNPAFHLIPQANLVRLGYKPDASKLNSFLNMVQNRALAEDDEHSGEEVGPGLKAHGFHLDEDDFAKFQIKRLQETNPGVYDEFITSDARSSGGRNHFREAWNVFQAGKGEQEAEDGSVIPPQIPGGVDFLEWIGMRTERWQPLASPDDALWKRIPTMSRDWQDTYWTETSGTGTSGTGTSGATTNEDEEGDTGDRASEDNVPPSLTEDERAWAADQDAFTAEGVDIEHPDVIAQIKAAYQTYVEEQERQRRIEQEQQERQDTFDALPRSLRERIEQLHAEDTNVDENGEPLYADAAHRWSQMHDDDKLRHQTEVNEEQRRLAREADVNRIIATQQLHGDFEDDEEKDYRDFLYGLDDNKFQGEVEKNHGLRRKYRIDQRKQEEKDEAKEAMGKPTRSPEELQNLKDRFKDVYKNAFDGLEMTPDKIAALDAYSISDYDKLDKEYQAALKIQHDNNVKEKRGKREALANNIAGPDGIDPLPENADHDDVMLHLRQIEMWKHTHLPYMTDKNAKDALNQLEVAAHQRAEALGFNARDFIKQDVADAENLDEAYGTPEWFNKVGESHIEEQKKTGRYQNTLKQGGDLRTNSNYKPWLVIAYDEAGAGHFLDLREQDPTTGNWGKEISRTDLMFDTENVGFDYTGTGDVSALGNPEETFWNGLDYANLKPKSKTEQEEIVFAEPPRVAHSSTTGNAGEAYAWYHPESKSWINPHRYFDAREEIANSPQGSGMVLLGGANQYHGRNAEAGGTRDAQYGFQFLGQGMRPNSYYLDGQGNIAHMNTDDTHKDMNQPQSVNSVVHDWHTNHMKDQVLNNQQQFLSGPGEHHDKVILSPAQQIPLQNAVQVGDALHRRRQQGSQYSRRRFDKLDSDELGFENPTNYGQRGRLQRLTPRTATEKFKQGVVGAAAYTESGMLTGLAKLALNAANVGTLGLLGLGWGKDQNNIRRHRAVYNKQHTIERQLQDHMLNVTDNGRIRRYLSPGEENARKEDHKAVIDHLAVQRNWHQNQAATLRNAGDKEEADKHEQSRLKYQALNQEMAKLNSVDPEHWKRIDETYKNHMSSTPGNAPSAPTGEQPSQNLADIFNPSPPTVTPNWDDGGEITQNWS